MQTLSRLPKAALLAALAVPLLLTSCEGMNNPLGPDPDKLMPGDSDFVRSKPLHVPEFDFLWERSKFMLQTDGYGIDGSRTSRDEKEIVSQWKTILQPARYQGKRRRVVMRFEPAAGDDSKDAARWIAECAVVVQRNEDIQNPMEIARAVWKEDAPDLRRAEVFVYKLETGFQEPEEDDEAGASR
jgi:hypothetical protein